MRVLKHLDIKQLLIRNPACFVMEVEYFLNIVKCIQDQLNVYDHAKTKHRELFHLPVSFYVPPTTVNTDSKRIQRLVEESRFHTLPWQLGIFKYCKV